MKTRFAPFLIVPLITLMAACSSDKPVAPLALDYSSFGKINLAVASINVTDRSLPVMQGVPEAALRPTISEAFHRWVDQRLSTAGSSGQAVVVLKDATLTVSALPTKGDWFTREQAIKYSGHVAFDIEANGPDGTALASAEAHREVTLPKDPSMAERQKAYNELLEGLMADLNGNLDQSIHEHMQNFLAGAPMPNAAMMPPAQTSAMPSGGLSH